MASEVFRHLEQLTDDDLKVCLRAAGNEQIWRLLGLGHACLFTLDAQYALRVAARDRTLEIAKAPKP